MSLINRVRSDKLIQRAREHFDPELREIECQILVHCARSTDPEDPSERAQRQDVRAEFIRWLSTDAEAAVFIDPAGIRIWSAHFTDDLDLSMCGVLHTIEFRFCSFDGEINLVSSELRGLYLLECIASKGLWADRIVVHGPLTVKDFQCADIVNLTAAHIEGEVSFAGTTLGGRDVALSLDGASVGGDLLLDDGLTSAGTITAVNAVIGGSIQCSTSKLMATEESLSLDGATIRGDAFFRDGFEASGSIRMLGVEIRGDLDMDGGVLKFEDDALRIDRARITGSVQLGKGFRCAGTINAKIAEIGGNFSLYKAILTASKCAIDIEGTEIKGNAYLNGLHAAGRVQMNRIRVGGLVRLSDAVLTHPELALYLDGSVVKGALLLNGEFRSSGTVRLLGAQIGGQLNCSGAKLMNKAHALVIQSAHVSGGIFLRNGFEASGPIAGEAVRVDGNIECDGAVMTASDADPAISLEGAVITGNLLLRHGLQSRGDVWLNDSQIAGNVDCNRASLNCLRCERMRLGGELMWTGIVSPKTTLLILRGAAIANLHDDEASWPAGGNLYVDGLTYQELFLHESQLPGALDEHVMGTRLALNVADRVKWLNLQNDSYRAEPQPWLQLSKYLEGKGNKEGAKFALFNLRRNQAMSSGLLVRWWKILFARLEERPVRIVFSILLLVSLSSLTYWHAEHQMAPTDKEAYASWSHGKPYPSAYPEFNPVIYSLENLLPLVKFGQDDKWAPDRSQTSAHYLRSYSFLSGFRWFLIVAGWFQATVLAASIGARFKS